MILPLGSIINGGMIIAGGSIGFLLGNRLSESTRRIVFQGLGLCTLVLGMQLAMQSRELLVLIFSILLGSIAGELLHIEDLLNNAGNKLKQLLNSESNKFTEGFVSATMLFCIGSMAILGPLEEGLGIGRTTVLTKSILDCFAALALASAFGVGVLCAAFPVIIYQGSITLFAIQLQTMLTDAMRIELTATGGILIIGIGLNLLEITKIRLSNMLPALVFAVSIMAILPSLKNILPTL